MPARRLQEGRVAKRVSRKKSVGRSAKPVKKMAPRPSGKKKSGRRPAKRSTPRSKPRSGAAAKSRTTARKRAARPAASRRRSATRDKTKAGGSHPHREAEQLLVCRNGGSWRSGRCCGSALGPAPLGLGRTRRHRPSRKRPPKVRRAAEAGGTDDRACDQGAHRAARYPHRGTESARTRGGADFISRVEVAS
jgi:hypothetical protein